jgi:RNA polymerase sigma factor (sigma-70 family)
LEVAELVRAAAAGDQRAWDRLVDRFSGLIRSVARAHRLSPHDAGEVAQTTWLRLVEHLDRIENPDAVGSWLATTAHHESLRTLRLAARHVLAPSERLPDEGTDAQVVDANLLSSERDRALWDAFATLPERCQTLLRVLVADPAPSYEEVSAAIGMPIGSIGPTRARCLAHLRERAVAMGVSTESKTDRGELRG